MNKKYEEFVDSIASAYQDAVGKNPGVAKYLISVMEEIGIIHRDGGEGSGNWGHEGRPGEVGGSAEGGGKHNRISTESGSYTSFSKLQKKLAVPHKITSSEEKKIAATRGSILIIDGEKYRYSKPNEGFVNWDTGELLGIDDISDKECMVIVPDQNSTNYNLVKDKDRTIQELKNRQSTAFNTEIARDADDFYREQCGEVWRNADQNTKDALVHYTGTGYTEINSSLRNGNATASSSVGRKITSITNAISQSKVPQDAIVYRGVWGDSFSKMFGVSDLDDINNLDDLIGRIGRDKGFMSTGARKGAGFDDRDVLLKITLPKGTEALYCEPFSKHGKGNTRWDGRRRDGRSGQSEFSHEQEVLIQRNSALVITAVAKDEWQTTIECAVVSQNYKPLTH